MRSFSITIRPAGPDDNHIISALGHRTFADSFGADNHPRDMQKYLERSFGPMIQAAELAEPSSCFLIAESGDLPVGYARLVESPPPACVKAAHPIKLQRLYADQQWIGCGVGAALMRACIAMARHRQNDGIWLGVWDKNQHALQFYRRWGFKQVGTQPFILGDDHQIDLILWLSMDATLDNNSSDRGGLR